MTRRLAVGLLALVTVTVAAIVVLDRRDQPEVQVQNPADDSPCSLQRVAQLDYSQPEQGELVWADEFDGDTVDTERWTVRDRTKLSSDQALIRADNVSVDDGVLRIEAREEGEGERPVTTGYLDTIDRFSAQYGRWEIRARLPLEKNESRGLWPAFWIRGDETLGEIDVLEAWGSPADEFREDMERRYFWAIHENTMHPVDTYTVSGEAASDVPLADEFHTFALDWSPRCLRFSMNGQTAGVVDLAEHPRLGPVLQDTYNMRLNLQVGSGYWGRIDLAGGRTELPAVFEVDHVRVYAPI